MKEQLTHEQRKPSGIEKLLDKKYLATDGEEKVYILPDSIDVEQLMSGIAGGRMGELKQSQIWRKTDIPINQQEQDALLGEITDNFKVIDKRLKRLELLLQQVALQNNLDTKKEQI